MKKVQRQVFRLACTVGIVIGFSAPVFGHCDTMGGPVVKAAQAALRSGNINSVLIWVHETEEPQVRQAFKKVMKVRPLGRDARELADTYFFETVVRLHRAGEGEPFTGLKPSGGKDAALFIEIDNAIERGSIVSVASKFSAHARNEIESRFQDVTSKKKFSINDVAAGRRFVESYVAFLHLVEKLEGHVES